MVEVRVLSLRQRVWGIRLDVRLMYCRELVFVDVQCIGVVLSVCDGMYASLVLVG